MHFKQLASYLAVGSLGMGIAVATISGMNLASIRAQDGKEEVSPMTERGKVKSILKNDHDDVDGLLLDNGVKVHFPPHVGERVTAVVSLGDTIEVEGRKEVTPRGEDVFEMAKLVNGKESVQVDRPRPKPGPGRPRDEKPVETTGVVKDYARNPHGDVDGLILKDETVVKFSPRQSDELQELVAIGDNVTITGRKHVLPEGETHVQADRIEANGKTLEREGPKHGPKGHRHGPEAIEQDGPTNADLLRELKAIRQLLEKQAQR